ncbi:checkpoint protein Hus1/Mec3 [Fimicolochytrium jonesii]|uniref:checkpoint protein Hus1/Mec3 n=1 Tax=Fimicolochytrium jonesii TaxID=1396493 RepID=UPI0022FF331B|nr:checkpoint protein Hus1/Mec3 [Fimicolochytrium jonesii]KAI8815561.1 checkpoint protein Hus1/Mec3 [Fimicolochytrium jonesii]
MRLRARVINAPLLSKMALSLVNLTKRYVLLFTPTHIHFIVGKSTLTSTLQMFGQIMQDRIFEEYRLESSFGDKIYMEVAGDLLVRALRSALSAVDVKVKLTKKDGWPMLAFYITNASKTGNRVYLTQDVPVRILPQQEAQELAEPVVGDQQVHILLPPIQDVRNIAERMKSLGSHIVVGANMSGEFVLKISADGAKVETSFKGLVNPELSQADGTPCSALQTVPRERHNFAEVRVDMRDFIKFLHSSIVNPKHVVCCIVDGQSLLLYVYLGNGVDQDDGQFVYYVPARAS